MIEIISRPWPWYISGIVIALIMLALLFAGKTFGFSSNLRTICTLAGAGRRVKFFNFNWRTQRWNLLFLIGAIGGGWISSDFLVNDTPMQLSQATIADLNKLGIQFDGELNPSQLYGNQVLSDPKMIMILLAGGLLVGFGSRYAGGCTSGHAITGLSNLQIPSFLAVIGFFAGGLIMTHLLLPLIF